MSTNFFQEIDLSSLKDDEVIFFIRIRGKKSFFNSVYTLEFLKKFSSVSNYRTISEYELDADIHINLHDVPRDWLTEEEHKEFVKIIDCHQVITRCRGLRGIHYDLSKKLIVRAYLFFREFYQNNSKIKLIVSGTVDNYVMEIMQLLGESFGVKFIGVTDSFVSGYKLISMKGEASNYRIPTEDEVKLVYEMIKNSVVVSSSPSKRKILLRASYSIGSYVYRFFVRHLIRYHIQGRLEYEYIFAPQLRGLNSLDQLFAIRYLVRLNEIDFHNDKKIAYIPLHYWPEATTDYWVSDIYHVEYLASLLNTVEILRQNGYQVFAKEHPAFYLYRDSLFYKKLNDAGCHVLSPFDSTSSVFAVADVVVVRNGSTGIEALVCGKPVVKVTNSYYGDGLIPHLSCVNSLSDVDENIGMEAVRRFLKSTHKCF